MFNRASSSQKYRVCLKRVFCFGVTYVLLLEENESWFVHFYPEYISQTFGQKQCDCSCCVGNEVSYVYLNFTNVHYDLTPVCYHSKRPVIKQSWKEQ